MVVLINPMLRTAGVFGGEVHVLDDEFGISSLAMEEFLRQNMDMDLECHVLAWRKMFHNYARFY